MPSLSELAEQTKKEELDMLVKQIGPLIIKLNV